jgi:hypothetical protein
MSHQRAAARVERQHETDRPILWSDDECVQRLAALLEMRDSRDLSKIVSLIGRLAVPVVHP